jgi:alpha-1,6-mannosyltransferase
VALGGVLTAGAVALVVPDLFGWVNALGVPGTTRDGMAPSTWVSSAIALVTGQTSGPGLDQAFVVGRILTAVAGAVIAGLLLWRATGPGPAAVAYRGVGWALIVVALSGPSTYPWYLTWGLFAATVAGTYRERLWLMGLCVAASVAGCFSGGAPSVVVFAGLVAVVAVVVNRHRRTVLAPTG